MCFSRTSLDLLNVLLVSCSVLLYFYAAYLLHRNSPWLLEWILLPEPPPQSPLVRSLDHTISLLHHRTFHRYGRDDRQIPLLPVEMSSGLASLCRRQQNPTHATKPCRLGGPPAPQGLSCRSLTKTRSLMQLMMTI